jgi:hypothetical protein
MVGMQITRQFTALTSWRIRLFLVLLICSVIGSAVKLIRAVPLDAPVEKKAKGGSEEITVIPKINFQGDKLWADGATPVVIWISLEVVKGRERWPYTPKEEFVFNLGPGNSAFAPPTVKVLPGQSKSTETRLTARQQGSVEVTCTPDRPHNGVTIVPCEAAKMDFVFPINLIAIEPVEGESPINIARPFRVFLCNRNNPKVELPPPTDVSIQLESDNGNGNISESTITLTTAASSHLVRYMGTRLGKDAILANGTYIGGPIKGNSPRAISFPWFMFLVGVVGTFLGSLLRSWLSDETRKKKAFAEAFGCGLAFCLIVILFPAGTKLGIQEHVQPWLICAFAFLVSLIPEGIKKVVTVFA